MCIIPKDYSPIPPKVEEVEKSLEIQSVVVDVVSGTLELHKKREDDLKDGEINPEPKSSGK